MKTKVLTIALGWIFATAFAQKNELKDLEKVLKSGDLAKAMTVLSAAESFTSSMDDKSKSKFYFLKAQIHYKKKEFQTAADTFEALFDLENEMGKQKYTSQATTIQNKMLQDVYQKASEQYSAKEYEKASDNFYLTYKLSPSDTIFIYNAAVSSSLAKDYDASLNYYKELQELGYTGITDSYYATSKETGLKEDLQSKSNRDLQVKLGLYEDPVAVSYTHLTLPTTPYV